MRTRKEPAANYSSVYVDGKTLRFAIDSTKPITELKWPEFYDVAINSWCNGRCVNCYTSATSKGKHFDNVVGKINSYFGTMEMNQRPYQVALGGAGEPTAHPMFIDVLKTFSALNIVPNYTTNGMHLTPEIIENTKQYCGGVAISLHPQLESYWRKAVALLLENKIKTNVHIIISDKESIDFAKSVYEEYNGKVEYFVLLPHMNVGFGARNGGKQIDYDYLEKWVDAVHKNGNLAFGSNFYDFLKTKSRKYGISLYPPEIMSKYLIMDDNMALYNNSFNMVKVN